MPASEFREWEVLEAVEPFGEMGAYLRAGIVAAVIANVNRGPKAQAFTPWDFVPKVEDDSKVATPEKIREVMLALVAAQDAYLKRKEADNVRNDSRT